MSIGDLKLHGHSDKKNSSLGVNQSGPKMSATTNPIFYKAWERLHSSWCKQPLRKRASSLRVCHGGVLDP
jgi:hypothetical protein